MGRRLAVAALLVAVLAACQGAPDPDGATPADAPVSTVAAAAPAAPTRTPSPNAIAAPADVHGLDHVLFKVLQKDNTSLDWTTCAGVEVTDTGTGTPRAILDCTSTDPSFQFTIRFRWFSRSADANAYLDSLQLTGTPGVCADGGSEKTNWTVDDQTVGRVVCDLTDSGSPAMWWGATTNDQVVGQINEPTAAVNWAWWMTNATIVPYQ